ncbi:MAG: DNA cytosine methyltransferase [Acidobacteriaceae bacterium]|nr:DNA cytosine methyltransferase [Acidobacteriaceae bacterium]MBV9308784.1 DNA cytosine methyltransferase [Acidobacteriaceae bacterium]
MSSLIEEPLRFRSPFKTKNGVLPFWEQDCIQPLHDRETRSALGNPYLSRLRAFTKELLNDAPFNLISLFCGGGGLDLGLSFAGFETRVASDVAPAFVDSVITNLPHAKPCKEDALELTKDKLCELARTTEIDLVAAGPPCQSFSILGRRGALADPRGKLALKYFDLIADIQPRAFLFENVPGLLNVNKGEDWRTLVSHAKEKTGYYLHIARLNAAIAIF